MTGKLNVHNYVQFGVLDKNEKTFGHMMKESGYATGVVGKWQLYGEGKGTLPENTGFDEHCLWNVDDRGSRYWEPSLRVNGEKKKFSGENDYGPDI